MAVRGIRGAITVEKDENKEISEATQELLTQMISNNGILSQDIISIIFTMTPDLRSAFPAEAARAMGLTLVPLLCTQEIPVPGALPLCIRVLMHINTEKPQDQIKHQFMRAASQLRPDLSKITD